MFLKTYLSRQQIIEAGYPISMRGLNDLQKREVLVGKLINGKKFYKREHVDAYFLSLAESRAEMASCNSHKKSIKGRPTKKREVAKRQKSDLQLLRQTFIEKGYISSGRV